MSETGEACWPAYTSGARYIGVPATSELDLGVTRYSGTEVHQDGAAALLAHDVLGLHVAVHEARLVNGRERAAKVESNQPGLLGAEAPLVLSARPRASGPESAPSRGRLRRRPPRRRRPRPRWDVEPGPAVAPHGGDARSCRVLEQLERDVAPETIARAVDAAECAAPNFLEDRQRAPAAGARGWSGLDCVTDVRPS